MENNTAPQAATVMSVSLRYGLIMTLVTILINVIMILLNSSPFERDWKAYVGIAALAGITVLAHNYFKENGDGYMSYSQGLGIGFMSVSLALLVSGIFSFLYAKFIDPQVMEAMWEKAREQAEAKGQNEEAVEMGLNIAKKFFWVFYIVGSMFWGLIIGLIISIFTQKKRAEPGF